MVPFVHEFLTLLFFLTLLNCGISRNTNLRIIGGTDAHVGQYRYAVAINVQTADSRFFCGGSLLNNQWILTAGKCVDGNFIYDSPGTNKLSGDDPNRLTVATSTYVLHPDYNPLTLENDIGLVKLRSPVDYEMTLGVLNVFYFNITAPASDVRDMWAIGWGQTSDQDPGLNNVLQTVSVVALSNEECKIYYGSQITSNTLCVEGNYNEETCYGDTGSPLVVDLGRGYKAIGAIASFISGNGCESTEPSEFLRTAPYKEWIMNVTDM